MNRKSILRKDNLLPMRDFIGKLQFVSVRSFLTASASIDIDILITLHNEYTRLLLLRIVVCFEFKKKRNHLIKGGSSSMCDEV